MGCRHVDFTNNHATPQPEAGLRPKDFQALTSSAGSVARFLVLSLAAACSMRYSSPCRAEPKEAKSPCEAVRNEDHIRSIKGKVICKIYKEKIGREKG
jgi:hypothetical protein